VEPITLTASGGTITNPGSVHSEPIITVHGTGDVALMVGTTLIDLEGIKDSITLNTPLMEAYSGLMSMNGHMTGEFPVLKPGMNAVSWVGDVSKVVVEPNWQYL
jgi:phage-related protein